MDITKSNDKQPWQTTSYKGYMSKAAAWQGMLPNEQMPNANPLMAAYVQSWFGGLNGMVLWFQSLETSMGMILPRWPIWTWKWFWIVVKWLLGPLSIHFK